MYKKVEKCRICGNKNLVRVLDLGEQMLTGIFPASPQQKVTVGPLHLVKCTGVENCCGLLQLEHSYDLAEMYGENYGYRSGLNLSMVQHLNKKVEKIVSLVDLTSGDLVIDIGSNDSTTLQAYPKSGLVLVGIDPTGSKFKDYYPEHIRLIPDFFSAEKFRQSFPKEKAKVVTSFSMFYDLESPMAFMQDIYEVLDDEGVWVFEQSYMPMMLKTNSYDTVCHEHLEFYALSQIKWMTDRIGFKIIDVEFNDVNGGSFSITVKKSFGAQQIDPAIQAILDIELQEGYDTLVPFQQFSERVKHSKQQLLDFVLKAKSEGKVLAALGASTKGNVLLQYCGLSKDTLSYIGEVNQDKFGRYTPGTWIPIISEKELIDKKPDYLIVLPWHFKEFFLGIANLKNTTLVFPLPELEIVKL